VTPRADSSLCARARESHLLRRVPNLLLHALHARHTDKGDVLADPLLPTASNRTAMLRARLEALEAARSALAALIARGGGGGGGGAFGFGASGAAAATATAAASTTATTATTAAAASSARYYARAARAPGAQRRAHDDAAALELAREALAGARLATRAAAWPSAAAAAATSSSQKHPTLATTRVAFAGVRAAGSPPPGAGSGGGGEGFSGGGGGGGGPAEPIEGEVGVPPAFPVLPPGVPDFFGSNQTSGAPSASLSPSLPPEVTDPGSAGRLADDSGLRGADDGADATEARLFFRERVERAALPASVKRAIFSDAWQELVYDVRRTAKVTTAGRLMAYRATVVVGNLDGLLGVGEARGASLQRVLLDAHLRAYERVRPVPRYRGHTLYHACDSSHHKARVRMWPRPAGWGVVASDTLAALFELAGVRDVAAKASGRRKNKGHVLRAFLQAVEGQSLPHDGVEGSGVYVHELAYGSGGSAGAGKGVAGARLPWKMKRGVDLPA